MSLFDRKKRALTDMQKAFLTALRDPDNKGDLKKCKDVAGYSKEVATSVVVNGLKDEIIEVAKEILANNAVKASIAIVEGVDDPVSLGIKERCTNAERILDRVGIVKGEHIQVENAPNNIFLIPRRNDVE